LRCVQCDKRVKVKAAGPLPMYCSGACKQAAFQSKQPKPEPKPKEPKVSLEERVAMRVYQMLLDTNVITRVDAPLPPKREPDQE
jgi:hypothetical protein